MKPTLAFSAVALIALAVAAGCGNKESNASSKKQTSKQASKQARTVKPETSAVSAAASFQLVCDSSDTKAKSTLFCMRHDTRTGDVKRVIVAHIPVSRGPTAGRAKPAGTYQLVCHSTRSDDKSNVYCVRLDTETGELLLVALPKVGVIPRGSGRSLTRRKGSQALADASAQCECAMMCEWLLESA